MKQHQLVLVQVQDRLRKIDELQGFVRRKAEDAWSRSEDKAIYSEELRIAHGHYAELLTFIADELEGKE